MKILLLDSPSWQLFNPRMHLHLGILYLAGSLRSYGYDVKVVDCHKVTGWDGKNLIIHQEMLEPCDVLGISATTANVNYGQQLASAWPAKIKILGGTHVTHIMEGSHEKFKQRKYFEGFDYLMYGECEEAFVCFCDSLRRGSDPKKDCIPGLVWWEGSTIHRMAPPPLPDVTALARPAFDLWEAGFSKGALSSSSVDRKEVDANELMSASMYTTRGCPYGCTFCADARTKLREETKDQIYHQIKELADLGVKAIRLQDDTFTIKEYRCRQIAWMLHDHGMIWRACTRVNLRDNELFHEMARTGCTELGFGIEHGSAKMLKAMNKGTTPEANEVGVKMCQDAGMIARAFTMLGFPGETEETIDEMEQWIFRVKPDAVTVSIFQPFPGSQVWNDPGRFGVSIPDDAFSRMWQLGMDGDPSALVLDLPTISKERLFVRKQQFVARIEKEIGALDRTKLHGNIGTFGPVAHDAGLSSDAIQ